jgi:hypothetical protein
LRLYLCQPLYGHRRQRTYLRNVTLGSITSLWIVNVLGIYSWEKAYL